MMAYARAKKRADESLAPNSRLDAMVERRRPIDRYETKVLSFANHTLASTLTGVGIFSVSISHKLV